jgi:hypothetical protein
MALLVTPTRSILSSSSLLNFLFLSAITYVPLYPNIYGFMIVRNLSMILEESILSTLALTLFVVRPIVAPILL